MAKKQVWTVRVVNMRPDKPLENTNLLPGLWVEQLRYMGVLKVLLDFEGGSRRQVLEFHYPHDSRGIDTERWALMQASRMRSFGINAIAAPAWPVTDNFTAEATEVTLGLCDLAKAKHV